MEEAYVNKYRNGLDANTLKWIAIIAMILDHIASGFLPGDSWPYIIMRLIGRITGPTMFYMVSVGYRHTRNKNSYTLRLALFALVSYLPYIYFHTGTLPGDGPSFLRLNVIYTILMGLLAIRAQHEIPFIALRIPVLCVLMVLAGLGDWGLTGFLIMLAFDFFYGSKKGQLFAYLLVVGADGGLFLLPMYPLLMYQATGQFDFGIYPNMLYRLGLILPMVLLWLYNGEKGKGGTLVKWSFYIIYPLHFLILGFIRYVLLSM